MTRATGRGVGVTAQFHVWLDHFFSQQHWQACFLIAMKIRLSIGTAAPASAWLLCYAAE